MGDKWIIYRLNWTTGFNYTNQREEKKDFETQRIKTNSEWNERNSK